MNPIDQIIRKAISTTVQFAKLIPQIWAAAVEPNLRKREALQQSVLVNRDLEVPGAGDTVFIPFLGDIAAADDLTEGVDMAITTISTAQSFAVVPAERGKLVEITRKALDRIKYDGVAEVLDRLAYSMTLKIEGMIALLWNQSVILTDATNLGPMTQVYPNGHNSTNVTLTDVLDDATMLNAIATLEERDAVNWPDGYYRFYCTPRQYAQLLKDQNIRNDIRFASPDRLLNNEKGAIHGCRIVVTNYIVTLTENAVTVAKGLLLTPRWAVIAYKRRPEVYVDKTLYDGGRRRRFGVTADFDIKLLHQDRAIVVCTSNA
jgi:N4-gp56 family major capsid protein